MIDLSTKGRAPLLTVAVLAMLFLVQGAGGWTARDAPSILGHLSSDGRFRGSTSGIGGGPPSTLPVVTATLSLSTNHLSPGTSLPPVGPDPLGPPAYDPVNKNLYVPMNGLGYVTVINTTSEAIVSNVSVGGGPTSAAFDPENGYVYVSTGSSTVAVINGTTNVVVDHVQVGTQPDDAMVDGANGNVLVTNSASNNITVINGTTNKVEATITTPTWPTWMTYDPTAKRVYVADVGINGLMVIDGLTNRVVDNISFPLSFGPDQPTYDVKNGLLYVLAGPGNLFVVNTTINAVVGNYSFPSFMDPMSLNLNPVTRYLYVTDWDANTITVVNDTTGSLVGVVKVGSYPQMLTIDPATGHGFVGGGGGNIGRGWIAFLSSGVAGPSYGVTFSESGLPASSTWGVALGSDANSTSGSAIVVLAQNGTYPYAVHAPKGYLVTPSSGVVHIASSSPPSIPLIFTHAPLTSVQIASPTSYVMVGSSIELTAVETCNGGVCETGTVYSWSLNNTLGTLNATQGTRVTFIALSGPGAVQVLVGATLSGKLVQGSLTINITTAFRPTGSTLATLVLSNNTLVPGNYVPGYGQYPQDLAMDPLNDQLLVVEGGPTYLVPSGTTEVAAVNMSSHQVAEWIPVGSEPTSLALDPATGDVLVTNSNSNDLTLIDGRTDAVLGLMPLGMTPYKVVYDATNHHLYVATLQCSLSPFSGFPCNAAIYGRISVFDGWTGQLIDVFPTGALPTDIAVNPSNGDLYVANEMSNSLEVINGTNDATMASIPIPNPCAVAVDASNDSLFVSECGGSSVGIVSPSLDTIVGSVPVGLNPLGITFDSTQGKVYVGDSGSSNVTVINGSTNRPVGSIQVGAGPTALTSDSQTDVLYVTSSGPDTATAIAANNDTVQWSASLGKNYSSQYIATDPSNGRLYLANLVSNNVSVVSPDTERVMGTAGNSTTLNGPDSIAVDPRNGQLYVAGTNLGGGGGTVAVINATTLSVTTYVPVSTWPSGIVYDPLNGMVYVTETGTGDIGVIDPSSNSLSGTISVGGLPTGMLPDPSNGYLYVSDGGCSTGGGCDSNVDVVNLSSGLVVRTISVGIAPMGLTYDPLRGWVYVANSQSDSVSVINDSSNTIVTTIPVGSGPAATLYDSFTGFVYVSNAGSGNLSVVNATSNVIMGAIEVGRAPMSMTMNTTSGYLFVADAYPGTVSVVSPQASSSPLIAVSVAPPSATLSNLGSQSFNATSICNGLSCPRGLTYRWTVNNTLGSLNTTVGPSTTFTAGPTDGFTRLTVAASLDGVTKWANVTIAIANGPVLSSVSISPTSITVGVGNGTSLMAHPNCTGGTCPSGSIYSWALNNTAMGTLSPTTGATEIFTAGSTAGSVILYATAYLNGHQATGLAVINITKSIVQLLTGLTLTPSPSVLVQVGKSLTFNATPSCSVSPCPSGVVYTWVLNNTLGNLSSTSGSSVVLTTGAAAGATSLTVTAQLNGGSRTATSDITITNSAVPVITGVTIAPGSATVKVNQGQGFIANATCSPGPCPSSTTYAWALNNSLGSVSPSTGISTQFTAGSSAGEVTLRVNATYNGKTVTNSVVITIQQSGTPPTNHTPPPTFLGLPGYDGYVLLIVVAVVGVAAVVIALTRWKKAETVPPPSAGYQGAPEYPMFPQQPPYTPGR